MALIWGSSSSPLLVSVVPFRSRYSSGNPKDRSRALIAWLAAEGVMCRDSAAFVMFPYSAMVENSS